MKKWKNDVVFVAFIGTDGVMGEDSPELRQIIFLAVLGKQSSRRTTMKKYKLDVVYCNVHGHVLCDGQTQSRINTNTFSSSP